MKAFVVNLDRNISRLAHMTALLGKIGTAFERVAAVDGRDLDRKAIAAASPDLSPGEIGCLMSHREVWRRIVTRGEPYASVLEDDIFAAPTLARLLEEESWIPADADIVKLETTHDLVRVDQAPITTVCNRGLLRLRSTHPGSAGYVLSAKAAASLLARTEKLRRPVDAALFELPEGEARGLTVYQVDPAVCIQNDFLRDGRASELTSTIRAERSTFRRKQKGIFKRLVRGDDVPRSQDQPAPASHPRHRIGTDRVAGDSRAPHRAARNVPHRSAKSR